MTVFSALTAVVKHQSREVIARGRGSYFVKLGHMNKKNNVHGYINIYNKFCNIT